MPITKMPKSKSATLKGLIERVKSGKESVESVFEFLKSEDGADTISKNIDAMRLRDDDGYMVADELLSNGSISVVKSVLEMAATDARYKKLLGEVHELSGGIAIAPFALALTNLRNNKIDDKQYKRLAIEIGQRIQYQDG